MDDNELLRQYADEASEAAFATLVARHINLVYSTALRYVRQTHPAEEITQAVFVILARKAGSLRKGTVLPGWLYHTARLTAANFMRSETQRIRREQQAHEQSLLNEPEPDSWSQVAPVLDMAMAGLNEQDRNAIVLRFFEGRNMREVGTAMGSNEEAARKRVNRAVEKLRKCFTRRGVTLPAAAILTAVSANAVHAAPSGLAVSSVAAAKASTLPLSLSTLIKGALKLMAWAKIKTAIAIGAATVIVAGTTASVIVQSDTGDFPRAKWKFAGYANPQSALQSMVWAWGRGDATNVIGSLTPEAQEKQRERLQKMKPEDLIQEFRNVTGYRLIGSETNAADHIILDVHFNGVERQKAVRLRKVGTEWKLEKIP